MLYPANVLGLGIGPYRPLVYTFEGNKKLSFTVTNFSILIVTHVMWRMRGNISAHFVIGQESFLSI